MTLVKMGSYQRAFEAFKRGADEAKAHNNMGMVYLKEGRPEEAITSFEKALETNPSYYLRASENLKIAKMALADRNASPRVTPATYRHATRALKPLRLQLDTSLSNGMQTKP